MAPETHAAPMKPAASTSRAWEALTPPLAEWILDAVSSMGFRRYDNVKAALPGRDADPDVAQYDARASQYHTSIPEKQRRGCRSSYRIGEDSSILDTSHGKAFTIEGTDQAASCRSHHIVANKVRRKEANADEYVLKGAGN